MILNIFTPKRKSKSWKEVREEIIQAIEEEEAQKQKPLSISSIETYPPAQIDDVYSGTASGDSYPLA